MKSMSDLPAALATTRETLHRVAAHILGRRRYEVSGRFGLRASPGGIATPAFGEGAETLRVAGDLLVREVAGKARYLSIAGSTMRDLALFAGTDISTEFSCGADTPPLGDIDRPLHIDNDAAGALAEWYTLGWHVLDQVVAALPAAAEPDVIQLWPEHFDVGTNVGLVTRSRVNLGASPGDRSCSQPYIYVGPWGPERPGDPSFWNAPFGAIIVWTDLHGKPDAVDRGIQFLRTGLEHLVPAQDES